MENEANFWDKVAVKYAASPIRDEEAYEYTLGRTASYLGREDQVLEIGAGSGTTALRLAPSVAQIVGTDISSEMTRIATEKAEQAGTVNAVFRVETARDAVEKARDYDAVLGFNILHLTENLEDLLDTAFLRMKPGSLLITKTPCLSEPSIGPKRFLFRMLIPVLQAVGKAPKVRMLSFQELEAAITWGGFKIIETGSYPAMSRYIVARRP